MRINIIALRAYTVNASAIGAEVNYTIAVETTNHSTQRGGADAMRRYPRMRILETQQHTNAVIAWRNCARDLRI